MSDLSSLNVPSGQEAGRGNVPALPAGHVLPVRWTADQLAGLDWRKMVELTRALAVGSGWKPEVPRISPDGMVEFTMTVGTPHGAGAEAAAAAPVSVVRLTAWNRWMASGDCMERFAADLAVRENVRGVFLAPGGISPAARVEAAKRGIEAVDGETLATTLNAVPAAHSEFYHDMTFSGQPFVPSCPVCLRPLTQAPESELGAGVDTADDIIYRTSDLVAEMVVARRLEIEKDSEVHFLRQVRAKDVFVHGQVIGDFLCEGTLLLNPGARLTGNVAARSVLVRPGAELDGETRILKGSLGPVERLSTAWLWACSAQPKKAGCEKVRFLPH